MEETTKAQVAQGKKDKAINAKDFIFGKKKRVKVLELDFDGEAIEFKFQAISAREMDALRAKFPPTKAQEKDGFGVNFEKFNPALVAATLIEPELTLDEITDLYADDNWSAGELAELHNTASAVCFEGASVPSSANG